MSDDTSIPTHVNLAQRWTVGQRIGGGGFGQVYAASDEADAEAAIKFVPVEPGTDRELLLAELTGRTNVVPVLDHGTVDAYHVLVMPRADKSLRQHLNDVSGPLGTSEVRDVARDVGIALQALAPDVVHRDLKPENVLLLDGVWMVTDFGISRYIDASTATHTRAGFMSAPYTAPERWNNEPSAAATDVYALGIMLYEMLAGQLPFNGFHIEDFAEAHRLTPPPQLEGVPPTWASLVDECLSKSPAARPSVENVLARLERMEVPESSTGLGSLASVNASVVRQRAAADAEQHRQQTEAERRQHLFADASRRFGNLAEAVIEQLRTAAPSGDYSEDKRRRRFALGRGHLDIVGPKTFDGVWRSPNAPAFDVAAFGHILVEDREAKGGDDYYYGRSHSLWFGDIQEEGVYGWFETAFMETPLGRHASPRVAPFCLDADGEHAPQAVWNGMAHVQVAWPFEPFNADTLDLFIERWSAWLAQASQGRLSHPSHLPERSPQGSWRER